MAPRRKRRSEYALKGFVEETLRLADRISGTDRNKGEDPMLMARRIGRSPMEAEDGERVIPLTNDRGAFRGGSYPI